MILENTIKNASVILKNNNISSHQLDAEIILSNIMGVSREFLLTKNHEKATTTTILTTGRAIIGTSITLGMGFLVLLFSNFKPNFEFGILATIILMIALISVKTIFRCRLF